MNHNHHVTKLSKTKFVFTTSYIQHVKLHFFQSMQTFKRAENTFKRTKGAKVRPFPKIAHDMCHFQVYL